MKKKPAYIWITVLITLAAIFGAYLYVNSLEEPKDKSALFMTIGIDQTKLATEVSSYELQRAAEHFSDIVLGWTVEPSFQNELEKKMVVADLDSSFTGRRQEKQNLLFISNSGSESTIEALAGTIEDRIAEYNAATNAGYTVAVERTSTIEVYESGHRVFLGIVFMVLIFCGGFLTLVEYANRR